VSNTVAAIPDPSPKRMGRSVWAIFAGFLVVFVLSLGTDEVLHLLNVYPPWNAPMFDPGLNALALGYRLVYDTLGSYLTARWAPHHPMRHVWIGAAIGVVLSAAGAVAAIKGNFGPAWYPIALAVSGLPTAWLGGTLFLRSKSAS
jgi:hypothetical protein